MSEITGAVIAIALWQFAIVMFQVTTNRRISSMHYDVIRAINQLRNEMAAAGKSWEGRDE